MATKHRAYVRLINAALEDLRRIADKKPSVLRPILKKLKLLERDPEAGAPLRSELAGSRKLTAVDKDWRIVWRASTDASGGLEITVSEVWAVGARSDDEIYDEMRARVDELPEGDAAVSLAKAIELLGRHAERSGVVASPEPTADPVPPWLRERLFHTVGMADSDIENLTGAEAIEIWERHITGADP